MVHVTDEKRADGWHGSSAAESGWYHEARKAFVPVPGRRLFFCNMLKRPSNVVLGLKTSSTYPRGHASGVVSPAAALEDPFEHAAGLEEGKS